MLEDTIAYLEKTKKEPRQKKILETVQKAYFNAIHHQKHVEKDLTIVKSSIFNPQIFHIQSLKSSDMIGTKIYVSLLHHLRSLNLLPSIPPCLINKKNQEIAVRLNSKEQKATLPYVSTKVLLKDLNIRIESKRYCNLRAVKRFSSGDFAILTVNNKEVKKLQSNIC